MKSSCFAPDGHAVGIYGYKPAKGFSRLQKNTPKSNKLMNRHIFLGIKPFKINLNNLNEIKSKLVNFSRKKNQNFAKSVRRNKCAER